MTASGPQPGVAGSPESYSPTDPGDVPSRYSIHLERNPGETRTLTDIESVDVVREHTDSSDWQATVPEDPTLPEWRFADVEVRYQGNTLFTGTLQRVDPSVTDAETVLEGYGPGSAIRFGHVRVEEQNVNLYRVIERVWRDHTPFDALVLSPEEPQAFSKIELSGTPKSILKELHDRAGMRFYFTMLPTDGPDVISFRPGRIVRPSGWTRIDIDPRWDVGDYRNAVVVEGAYSEELGRRYRGEAVAEDEIARVGERLEESIGPEPDLESDEDCQQIADSTLEDRLAEDQQEGSVDILPRLLPPGVRVDVPYYGEERDLERVSYQESLGEASGTLDIERPYSVAERTEEVDADLSSTKEMIR
ncbi:hypothetical protein [Haloterrigena salifodinae]|uniref:hypothetical protein n=1 Tax=Haloterrigena salifodinae TaxID=2675099 RepID=UPI000F881C89|nr:hypothetical protein [Haloterrigena salifodinae]